ncbi:MAG: hypothetical protein WBN22_05680 [Verrucomicrobiia bacterium]
MADSLIKAAILTTDDGIKFVAFADFSRKLKNVEAAEAFLANMGLICSVPMTITFWSLDEKRRTLGNLKEAVQFLSDKSLADLPFQSLVLNVQSPQQSGRQTDEGSNT